MVTFVLEMEVPTDVDAQAVHDGLSVLASQKPGWRVLAYSVECPECGEPMVWDQGFGAYMCHEHVE